MEEIKKVFQQVLYQGVGKLFSVFSTFIILSLLSRNYQETGVGIYTLALTYLAFFYLLVDLGLNAYVLPRLVSQPKLANELFSSRVIWSLFLILVSLGFLPLFPFTSKNFFLFVTIGSATILLSGILNSTNLIWQKNLRYDQSNIASAAGSLLSLPIIYYLVVTKASIFYLALIPLASLLISDLVALFLVRKFYQFKFIFPSRAFFQDIKRAWPLSATLLLNVVYFRVDAFILSSYRSFAEVGIYNLAYSIFQSILVLPTFIMNGYYPLMIEKLSQGQEIFFQNLKKALGIVLLISLMATLATWYLSPIITLLIKGKSGFVGSIQTLRILSLAFPAYFLTSVLMWSLVTLKRYKIMAVIYLVGLLVNALLNFIFIPHYSFLAAAWITGAAEYLILILQITILFEWI